MRSMMSLVWERDLHTLSVLIDAIERNDVLLVGICLQNLASKSRRDYDLQGFSRYLSTRLVSEKDVLECQTNQPVQINQIVADARLSQNSETITLTTDKTS